MGIVDRAFQSPRIPDMEDMRVKQALFIGAAQILSAAFPGTSRSMATIAPARWRA